MSRDKKNKTQNWEGGVAATEKVRASLKEYLEGVQELNTLRMCTKLGGGGTYDKSTASKKTVTKKKRQTIPKWL